MKKKPFEDRITAMTQEFIKEVLTLQGKGLNGVVIAEAGINGSDVKWIKVKVNSEKPC